MKRGRGEEKFEICVYTHITKYLDIYIPKLDGEPYRITPVSVVRPGLEASLRSAINHKKCVVYMATSIGVFFQSRSSETYFVVEVICNVTEQLREFTNACL